MDIDLNSIIENSANYRACVRLFGRDIGKRLHEAIRNIHENGLRVTLKNEHEIWISEHHASEGKLFRFADNYTSLIFPNNQTKRISKLSHEDITYGLEN